MMYATQVIVFASQKGGSGKTTLSGHIAVQAEISGAGPVALIDTDPQGSLAKWWNARASEAPAFAQVSVPDLGRDIETLKDNGFRLIVVDTPPAVTSSIAEVVTHADLVIVPTRPSPHDLRAVGPTVDIVERQFKPLVFVVNAATARARITGETAVALSQHGTVAPVTLHHRVDFAASMIDGRTVGEIDPNSRSAQEVAALWNYLADRLMRLAGGGDSVLMPPRPTFEKDVLTPARAGAAVTAGNGATIDHDFDDILEPVPQPVPPGAMPPVQAQQRRAPASNFRDTFVKPLPHAGGVLTGRAGPPAAAASDEGDGGWDGVERRKADRGPPPGMPERRRPRQTTFGRRDLQ